MKGMKIIAYNWASSHSVEGGLVLISRLLNMNLQGVSEKELKIYFPLAPVCGSFNQVIQQGMKE